MSGLTFADRLTARIGVFGPLCVGLDPFADRIPALFGDAHGDIGAVERFFAAICEVAATQAACVKLQLGLFEPYGAAGVAAAERLVCTAHALGLPVILDAKRGDIGTTAEGYAAASLGPAPGFDADAVTVNPYMGVEAMAPFFDTAQARGKGVAVLVRTSNPGAADIQSLIADGRPIWAHVAERLAPLEARMMAACGWSNLMIVAGATAPTEAKALRAQLPRTLFLVPGFGAQGASAADAMAGLPQGQGGVVNASRAAVYPDGALDAPDRDSWRAIIAAGMKRLGHELRVASMTA